LVNLTVLSCSVQFTKRRTRGDHSRFFIRSGSDWNRSGFYWYSKNPVFGKSGSDLIRFFDENSVTGRTGLGSVYNRFEKIRHFKRKNANRKVSKTRLRGLEISELHSCPQVAPKCEFDDFGLRSPQSAPPLRAGRSWSITMHRSLYASCNSLVINHFHFPPSSYVGQIPYLFFQFFIPNTHFWVSISHSYILHFGHIMYHFEALI
jgi:hypothetical protein